MEGPSSVAHFDDYHHDVHHHELSHSDVGVALTGDDEINLSVVRGNGVRDKSPPISLLFDNVGSNTSSGSGRRGERDKNPSIASLGFIVPPLSDGGTNPPASAEAGGAHNLLTPKSDLATSLLLNSFIGGGGGAGAEGPASAHPASGAAPASLGSLGSALLLASSPNN